MKKIYKYELLLQDEQVVQIPHKPQILSVQIQKGIICVWALVDTTYSDVAYIFEIIGTGNPVDNFIREYLGTVQDGSMVWHVFYRRS